MADVRTDDDDIDALMGSVVGNNGEIVAFPNAAERASKKQRNLAADVDHARRLASAANAQLVEATGELAAEVEANDVAAKLIDPRTIPVRFSNLKHMARSALHYWDAVQLGREDTLAMRLGRGAHAMVLGLPVVKWIGKTRQGKAWERFKAEHADAEILNAKEWAQAEGIAKSIRRHPIAPGLLFDGTVLEQTIEWEWLGRKCSSRPDSRCAGKRVIDLKTTRCADPEKFRWDAIRQAYHAQLAFYALADQHVTGKQPDELYAVAVESKRPYPVTVIRLTDEDRIAGEKICRAWFERLLTCEASDHWPAYTDAIVDLGVPGEGDPDAAIDIEDLPEEVWA
jgi:hypothetical protein